MSCESSSNRFARLTKCGITKLTSKRGFYAGLAAAGAGLVGGGLLIIARRKSNPRPQNHPPMIKQQSGYYNGCPIPSLQSRPRVKPDTKIPSSERCGHCRTPAGSKPGAWYTINGQAYCSDCAPPAANQAGVDLVAPENQLISGQKGAEGGSALVSSRAKNKLTQAGVPIVPGPLPRIDILSAEGLIQTRLVANKVLVRVSDNPPRGHVAEKAYVVKQRQNDMDTGLALTPRLRVVQGSGEIGIQEDTREWWVVHIPSGRTISHGGYTRIEEAHMLTSYLAQIDWTRDLSEISAAEITRTNNSISSYDQSLAQHKMSSQAGPAVTMAAAAAATAPPPPPGLLLGTLVADNQGGLARVLGEEGSKLFLMDFQGHRYETERAFVRQPTEADYNIAGTAMPVDPTIVPDEKCAICGARAKEAPAGTKWLKMEWKTYCDSCGPEHQRAEAFLKEEDIGTRETL